MALLGAIGVVAASILGVQIADIPSALADPAAGPGTFASTTPGAFSTTVPDGTCRAVFTAVGGNGASSGLGATTGGVGGSGATVTATFVVVPGQTVSGAVGGGGTTTAGGISGTTGAGGASGTIPATGGHRGGGGGGRTQIVVGGNSLIIAGGGGGGGAAHQGGTPLPGNGGAAGVAAAAGVGAPGARGSNGIDATRTNTGGAGGGAATGGAGGTNSGDAAFNGSSGQGVGNGTGGNGGPDNSFDSAGGGGGGYTGGGGGSSTVTDSVTGSGGGGGSSFVATTSPVATADSVSGLTSSVGAGNGTGSVVGANGRVNIDWQPCRYDLALTKSVAPTSVVAGGTVVWTIAVTNNGPDPMTKGDTIDLADTLPVGPNGPTSPSFKVLSITTAGGSDANLNSDPVTCSGLSVGAAMPATTNCSRPYGASTAAGSPSGGTRGLNVGETLTIRYEQNIATSAPCPATITNTATVKDRPAQTGTTDVVGNVVTNNVPASLNITCPVTRLRLVKNLAAARHNAADQFVMSISPGGTAPTGGSSTTAGSGSTVTSGTGVATVATATPGTSYSFTEAMAAGSVSALSQYGRSVTCVNATSGSSTTLPTAGSSSVPFSVTPAAGDDITCTLTNAPLRSALTIVKSTTSTSYSTVGVSVPYSFLVTNTGQVTLNSITVTDPNATGITCPVTTLAPNASTTCTATHVTTQADIDAGTIRNTASVTGTPPGGSPIPPVSSVEVVVAATQRPTLKLTKSTTKVSFNAVGESIPYSFLVENTGNVTLTTISVTDPLVTGLSCVASTLAPGATTNCSGTRVVTVADLDRGAVVNTASVVGTAPDGTVTAPVSSNTVRVPAVQTPSLTIQKTSLTPNFSALGQTVSYTFTIRNTGNVTMTAVGVTDSMLSSVTCSSTTLAPGATTTCTGNRVVTQADLDAGSIVNRATVVGTPPSGTPISPVTSNTVTVPAVQRTALSIIKSTTKVSYSVLGESIPYSFEVTNNGNVTMTNVSVSDPLTGGVTCVTTTLLPGASTTCSGSHTVTQTDLNGTNVTNTAQVVGRPPSGVVTSPVSSNTIVVPSIQTPRITIVKSTTALTFSTVGAAIPYSFTVRNEGNVTLTGIAVTDPKTNGVTCAATSLAPTASTTCTATHTVTQGDLDAGSVSNTALVGATPPSGTPIAPASSNTVRVPADQRPAISVVKSNTTPNFSTSGETINYKFVVTNNGNVTLNAILVNDAKIGAVNCPVSTLTPSASTTCTGAYVTTTADVAAGKIINTADVVATPPSGTPLDATPSNTVTVDLVPAPRLKIVKSTLVTSFATLNEVVSYTFAVSNEGNVALTALSVTDPNATGITCLSTSLALNASTTCTGSHTVTQLDLDTGSIINTARASATPPTGPATTPVSSNTVTVSAGQTAALAIDKNTTTTSVTALNSVIPYTFLVSNVGNVTVRTIAITDPAAAPVTCPATTLAPGASTTCTGSHTVTQADLDAGSIINTASVTGVSPGGTLLPPTGSDTVTVPVTQRGLLSIAKSTTTSGYTAAGQSINYGFLVTNIGNVTMTAITVTDPIVTSVACPVATLAPAASTTCTGSRITTQADMDAGTVVNIASVVGTPPSGTPVVPIPSNEVTVRGTQLPAFTVTKSTSTSSVSAVGDTIAYTFVVNNRGNVTLHNVAVTDAIVGTITCAPTTLAPGQQSNCSGTRSVTQADLDAGSIINTANAGATDPSGATLPSVASNTVTVPVVQAPTLSIRKSTTTRSVSAVGESIPYVFRVTNSGNVTLTRISVADPNTGPVICSPTTLAPGASVDCTATHLTTQADLDAGAVVNTATVVATPPSGVELPPAPSNVVSVPAIQSPGLTITKATTATTYSSVGASVPYSFVVENNGNVTLSGVVVSDPLITGVTCLSTTLAPRAATTCSGSHVVTQTDLDNGSIVNTASVSATAPNGSPTVPVPSNTVTLRATQTPALTIAKASPATSYATAGATVPYTFEVTNTGNVTMSSITVNDPLVAAVSCVATSLAPGASTTCSGSHLVTQVDLDNGSIVNRATVTGNPPGGSPITPVYSNTITVPAEQTPSLVVTKDSATPAATTVNQAITYTFAVTNNGNVTMTGIAVSDPMLVGLACAASALAPGASTSCSGTHLVTQADLDNGSIVNTASVVGTPPNGTPITPIASNTKTIPATQTPSLSILKRTTTGSFAVAGAVITYTFDVVNTGNVTISGVTINDPKLTSISCAATTLAGGAATQCTGTHFATQADVDAGSVVNTASVSGTAPGGTAVPPVASNTVTVPAIQSPALSIVKATTTASYDAVGDEVLYTFSVANTGNVTLDDIVVTDPNATGISCPLTVLNTTESMVCTGRHVVTLADLNVGSVANTAAVNAVPPLGGQVGPFPSNTVIVPAAVRPSLKATKSDSGAPISVAGDIVSYSVLVENDGNVTMSLVKVDDPIVGLTCPTSILDPGETTTCTGTHITSQAEIDAGVISNTAFVTGKPPVGAPIAPVPSNTVNVIITPAPAMTLTKATSRVDFSAVGDAIAYTFTITNTGNVTLTSVVVSDPNVSGLSCLANMLAPGANTSCTGTHIVNQTDLDTGAAVNTASVRARTPSGAATTPTPSNTVTVPAVQTASFLVVKATTTTSVAVVGDTIPYEFRVTNNGNVTLTGLSVTDANATGITCPFTTLTPSASVICTASHVVTQADLNTGSVVNIAQVTATPPSGIALPVKDSNEVTVPVVQAPNLSIAKSASVADYDQVGDVVDYEFTVRNSGNVTLTAVAVTDPIAAPITCAASTLLPTVSTTCTGSHTVTQADLDAGAIVNTARVTGAPPTGPALAPIASNTVTVNAVQRPAISVSKSTTTLSVRTVGELITYSFIVRNDGNVTISSVGVIDPQTTAVVCLASTLAPAATTNCTATRSVTQRDLDAGSIVNTATVNATSPSGVAVAPANSNTVTVPVAQAPAITIAKSTTATAITRIGQVVPYAFVVRNTGNVTLTDVAVSDPNTSAVSCAATTLVPGAETTCTASHTVTLVELNSGSLVNTASAVATPPSGTPLAPVGSNTVTLPALQSGSLSIVKSADLGGISRVGESLTYTLVVTNDGNVTVTNITVADPITTSPACPKADLVPGESMTCTATATVTQADLTRGFIANTATVVGTPPSGAPLSPISSNTVNVPARQTPVLTILKSTTAQSYQFAGEKIPYTFVVTNNGNVPLRELIVEDPMAAPITCVSDRLEPSESTTCSGSHTVTVDELNQPLISNVASASAVSPNGARTALVRSNEVNVASKFTVVIVPTVPTVPEPTTPDFVVPNATAASTTAPPSTPTTAAVPTSTGPSAPAAISLTKTSTETYAAVGDTVTFTFVIKNPSTTRLSSVHLIDPLPGLSAIDCGDFDATLDPDESVTCTATYAVTQVDIERGSITNTARAEAQGTQSVKVFGTSTTASKLRIDGRLALTGQTIAGLLAMATTLLGCGIALVAITRRRRA